jgi:hypothetical protein
VESQSAPTASQQAVDRSVPRTAGPVRMIRPARLTFRGPAENPAGPVDAVVLAAAGALGLEVLGETVTRGQPQAWAGQVVRAGRAASWALPRQLTRPGRASLRRIRSWRRPGDQVRGRADHGDDLFPGYPRMPA